jgi:hypothetical protein
MPYAFDAFRSSQPAPPQTGRPARDRKRNRAQRQARRRAR